MTFKVFGQYICHFWLCPDHHGGGPGCVGDGKNGLNDVHIIGHGEVKYMVAAYIMHVAVRRGSAMPIKVKTEEI